MSFRNDINALRALAVSAVVLFHYKLQAFSGGFIGVDVFFVISGYLMTQIINRRLEKDVFSLLQFYADRARRIIPPLYAMIFCLCVFGFFFIDPFNYQKLASTGVSALFFFSNFRFWSSTGYFDVQSERKWLLHTWSLSAEWQFYLIYPVVLIALYHVLKTPRSRLAVLWMAAISSLAACIAVSSSDQAAAFYLLPFRAWEMLAGGLVALQFDRGFGSKKSATAAMLVGLAMIAFACFGFNEHQLWPSYWALVPVIGTCLIIAARCTDTPLFANPLCRFLGEWSYSIYLWHWPIFVAYRYFNFPGFQGSDLQGHVMLLALAIALMLFLAVSLRRILAASQNQRLAWCRGIGSGMLVVAVAALIALSDGFSGRVPDGKQILGAYNDAIYGWTYPARCNGRDAAGNLIQCQAGAERQDTLFIGDSLAMQLYPHFVDTVERNPDRSFTFLTALGCPALIGVDYPDRPPACSEFVNKAFAFADANNYKRIVIVSNWFQNFSKANDRYCFFENGKCIASKDPNWFSRHLAEAFTNTGKRLAALTQHGAKVYVLSSTPLSEFDVPYEFLKRRFLGLDVHDVKFIDRKVLEAQGKVINPQLEAMAAMSQATFIDPLAFLCSQQSCPAVDVENVPLYIDNIHYSAKAVKSSRFTFLDGIVGEQDESLQSASRASSREW